MLRYCILWLVAVFFSACTGGGSGSNQMQVSINSTDSNYNVFAANIGETATHTYQISLSASQNKPYSVGVSNLPSAATIVSNTCYNVPGSGSCAIVISFTPTAVNQYAQDSSIIFSTDGINTQFATSFTPRTLVFDAIQYNPGAKTGIMASVGGGTAVIAEVDTGSTLTVVDQSVIGPNITVTNQQMSLSYGGGTRTISGYIAYGSVSFVARNGLSITTSSNTPLLVVPDVNQGGSSSSPNKIILGVELITQVSARLFMPYPYNQMMLISRNSNTASCTYGGTAYTCGSITFGTFNASETQNYGMIALSALPSSGCTNHGISSPFTNTCWNTTAMQVAFNNGSVSNTVNSLFDSGAGNAEFQFTSQPSWITIDSNSLITNAITASIPTTLGTMNIPLPSTMIYQNNADSKVNVGNALFNTYQVLFNQADGLIGLGN